VQHGLEEQHLPNRRSHHDGAADTTNEAIVTDFLRIGFVAVIEQPRSVARQCVCRIANTYTNDATRPASAAT
jgi:hypothetical protein